MQTMHLFAGGGGGLLADLILGHKPVVAVEWDAYACQILRERAADGWFPDMRVYEGDVRMFDPSEYAGRVDCIHAGFPCTDISVAGKQAGLGEGTRSGLYREVLRIAEAVRPKYLFLENVAAIRTLADKGIGKVLGDLSEMGYDSRWLTLRASDVGAPHHRDRWWCLCTRREELSSRAEHDWNGWRKQQQEGVEGEADVLHPDNDGQPATEIARSITERGDAGQAQSLEAGQPTRPSNESGELGSHAGSSWRELQDDTNPSSEGLEGRIGGEFEGTGVRPPALRCDTTEDIPNTVSIGQSRPRMLVHPSDSAKSGERQTGDAVDVRERGERQAISDLGGVAYELAADLDADQALQKGWWEVEPDIGRVTTGCEYRAHQLKALGNGQVPLQAAVAWRLLGGE